MQADRQKGKAPKVISRAGRNPGPFAPKGTNSHPEDDDYYLLTLVTLTY